MKNFIAQAYVPDKAFEERVIQTIEPKGEHLFYWTLKEFNSFYSGRNWRRFNAPFGVLGFQYMTTHIVRLYVRALDEPSARKYLSSFLWNLKPKEPRRKNSPPNSNLST